MLHGSKAKRCHIHRANQQNGPEDYIKDRRENELSSDRFAHRTHSWLTSSLGNRHVFAESGKGQQLFLLPIFISADQSAIVHEFAFDWAGSHDL
jgi:hypothetical protein